VSKWEDSAIPDYVLTQLESPDKVVVRPAPLELPFSDFIRYMEGEEEMNANFYLEYTSISNLPKMRGDTKNMTFAGYFFSSLCFYLLLLCKNA